MYTSTCITWSCIYTSTSRVPTLGIFNPGPSISEKASVAAQYYLSRARYSPLTSGNKGRGKVAFGSGVPRWPAYPSKPQPLLKQESRQDPLREQPFSTTSFKPFFRGQSPSAGHRRTDRASGTSRHKKDLLPSFENLPGGGWRAPLQHRPTVVSGAAYHSGVVSTHRANVHGRTDWTAK